MRTSNKNMRLLRKLMRTSCVLTMLSGCMQEDPGAVWNEPAEAPDQEPASSDILIAYFTWADNTEVEDPDAVDMDATTSASVLPPGNAAKLAGWIQEETGGELFSIQVEEPYSSDYDECLARAAQEKAEDARPALRTHVEDIPSPAGTPASHPTGSSHTCGRHGRGRCHLSGLSQLVVYRADADPYLCRRI